MKHRPVILCFVAYYLPGYQSGGPVRTIANFVDHFGDEFDIRIVTRDRDALDTEPYADVVVDAWNTVGKAEVFYASPRSTSLLCVARLLRETSHDLLYVNSFFNFSFTTVPLLARWLRVAPLNPCVIASRGEFSTGAIELKAWKKRPYLWLTKFLGLYRGMYWQASSEFEVVDIERELGVDRGDIEVAVNLPSNTTAAEPQITPRDQGPLRVVFLSRVSPKKNLDYLLRALAQVKKPAQLTIVGPLREPDYWEQCTAIMAELPPTVTVEYGGEVSPEDVSDTFSKYDLFVLPTRGENYGHVIFEALMAGTPVLISDQTPWKDSADGAVETLPLVDMDKWVVALERWAALDEAEFQLRKEAALKYARHYLDSSEAVEQNRSLFLNALQAKTP